MTARQTPSKRASRCAQARTESLRRAADVIEQHAQKLAPPACSVYTTAEPGQRPRDSGDDAGRHSDAVFAWPRNGAPHHRRRPTGTDSQGNEHTAPGVTTSLAAWLRLVADQNEHHSGTQLGPDHPALELGEAIVSQLSGPTASTTHTRNMTCMNVAPTEKEVSR